MTDLAKLSPAEMAAQLGRPTGEIGIAVGDYMSRINSRLIDAACELLALPPDGRVLEIGFGNGKLIGKVLARAPGLAYAGVDISDTMVREATANNQALVWQGRVELHLAAVDRLPFADATFDRALAVNTIYFWPDASSGLAEIRRVLRDDGFLVLASMTPKHSYDRRWPSQSMDFMSSIMARCSVCTFRRVLGTLPSISTKRRPSAWTARSSTGIIIWCLRMPVLGRMHLEGQLCAAALSSRGGRSGPPFYFQMRRNIAVVSRCSIKNQSASPPFSASGG